MSESLRDLVVSLSLNTDNFTRNIKSVSKQIQEAESYFRLASAGVKGFDSSAAGLSAKLEMLQRKLTLQQQVVGQYERALTAASSKLQTCHQRQEKYAQKLTEAKDKQESLRMEVETATAQYEHYRDTLGETDSATIAAKQNMEHAQQEYAEATAQVEQLAGQENALQRSTQNAADAVSTAQTQLNRARTAVRETEAEIRETNNQLRTAQSAWTAAGKSLTAFSESCAKVSKVTGTLGRTLTTTLTTPIAALATTAVRTSIEFESAFTSVRKTVNATESEFSVLEDSVKQMSTEIAASTTEISAVMATGGQLGIKTENLEEFTRVMIDLGNSCEDLSATDAATTIAQFANVMGTDQSKFTNIGSTIVELGNNFATTEQPIMEMAQRLAGAGKQVGLTEAQILGFSAALSSVGITAEMGGSAFSKALIKMEVAAETGGSALKDFASVAGMSSSQFKALWDADPSSAFMAFIEGLAKLDDEGISAIATLSEIGIGEVRLRDTMLRSVNATDLFAEALSMADSAWQENTALSTEANKRYATTESKLTNLKNKALLVAQTFGDDLNPTLQKIIEGVSDFVDKLSNLDTSERSQIIQIAAIAAAIGPALLAVSKITKTVGTVTGAFGKFATAVGKVGGGWKGFLTVLGSSPAVWIALSAAIIAGGVALADYTSGAKQAREALEGMAETAQNWKDTAAETFYGNSDGLSFFDLSGSDFTRDQQTAQEWMDGVIAAWSDGVKETNESVAQWTNSFKTLTDSTRTELQELKDTADANGYTDLSSGIESDIKTLDSMDAEITKLLKRRKNGKLTEKDKIRLQELIDTREAIEIKYHLTNADEGGFETIRQKVQAEVARAQARGQSDADVTIYENAVKASAEGLAAMNAQIDEQYDKEYALIQLIEDETERQTKLDELNTKYNEQRREAALEYAETLASVITPVWNQADIQEASGQMDDLFTKLREYSMASEDEKPQLLADLEALTADMDEGAMTEYLSLLTQIQSLLDSGLTEAEVQALFPDIDVSSQLDQFAGIADYLGLIKSDLPSLYSMFGESLPEEVLKIATDLDMTGAQARWNEFASNPGAITTEAIITAATTEDQQLKVEAFVTKYTVTDETNTTELTPEGLIAYVAKYAEVTTGADVSGLTPEIAECLVAGYKELASGADISLLTPSDIVAYVSSYAEQKEISLAGLSPDGLTAFVMAYEEATGGALTTALTPDDVTAMVTSYLQADGVDLSAITPSQIEAVVSSYAEATNCDKSQLLTSLTAYITEYKEAANVTVPTIQSKVVITGYDYMAYQNLKDSGDLTLNVPIRLGELEDGELQQMLTDGKVKFWQDGVEVPIEAVPDGTVDASTVASLDEDGTLHVLITPEVTGSQEAIDAISTVVDEADQMGTNFWSPVVGISPATTMDKIDGAMKRIQSYQETLDYNWWDKFWASVTGATTNAGVLDTSMKMDFDAGTVAELSAYVSEMVKAIQQGQTIPTEDLENLKSIVAFLNGLDTTGTGAHIKEGIAQGMTEAGFATDAETVASNLETALNTALDIHSPSKRVAPVGENVSAGVGEGMSGYSFASSAGTVAQSIQSALKSTLTSSVLRSIGINAMAGLAAGIRAGQANVIAAMRTAARSAVTAAKTELKIHSPSQVFRDEVGAQVMRGFGLGVERETSNQAKVIANAARFLTGEAKEASIGYNTSYDQRKYDQSSSVSVSGNSFYIRDEQDVRSLAIEIASLTRRRQRGKGLRMA